MKRTALCLLAAVTVTLAANAQTKKPVAKPGIKTPAAPAKSVPAAPVLKNSTDSFSYAVGCNIATSMKQQGITNVNAAMLQKAIDDVLRGRPRLLNDEQANIALQTKMEEISNQKSSGEKIKGEAFLASNKKKAGVTVLPNGLQYEVLQSGAANGAKPTVEDTVVVHYVGTLIDGTKFDASTDRGEPAEFPLGGVIRGWTEILQLMKVGDKWKVAIPSQLAYGDRGAGGAIPPGATLVFEIELLNIKPAVK
ncbi:MAG: FKBP-type peptidyl-prolyl cis-trans isomerase [Chitinophagaceae bacterium]|nr:MAG: FKBP-type peptidyl-prolyl cis-trans isomerase [Chitinophagaceae bacterium]